MSLSNINVTHSSNRITKVAMFILAICPLLSYYRLSIFTYDIIAGLLLFITCVTTKKLKRITIPKTFLIFWGYLAIRLIVFSGVFKITYLIPGGINFFLWSLCLIAFSSCLNIELLRKYVNVIFIFASALFIIQYVTYFTTGQTVSVFLPLGKQLNYVGLTYNELVLLHENIDRSNIRFSSIFAEPSYFGQYSIIALTFDIFCHRNKYKLLTPLSLYIIAILLFIQSGVGIVCLAFIYLIKIIYICFKTKKLKYYLIICILAPIVIYAINYYISTDIGSALLDRANKVDGSSGEGSGYVRTQYGYIVYGNLDTTKKMFGTSSEYIANYIKDGGFFNGISTILIEIGLIGTILLIIFYFVNCRKNGVIAIAMVIILILVSAMEATYLGPLMMICTTIAFSNFDKASLVKSTKR